VRQRPWARARLLAHFRAAADLHSTVADILAEVPGCAAPAAPAGRRRTAPAAS